MAMGGLFSTTPLYGILWHGAELEFEDDHDETPLTLGGCSKRAASGALTDAGANINDQNPEGRSMLDKVAKMGGVDFPCSSREAQG